MKVECIANITLQRPGENMKSRDNLIVSTPKRHPRFPFTRRHELNVNLKSDHAERIKLYQEVNSRDCTDKPVISDKVMKRDELI